MKKLNEKIYLYEKFINIVDKYYKIIFWGIFALALFLNAYKLGIVPKGINVDEAGMVYDAYCISGWGVDRFLKHLPVFFINFGGIQSALYTYLTSIIIKVLGTYNLTIVRIPALVLSMVEVVICYFLVKEYRGKKQGLLFMFLVTIMPWHIMKSRWGLDCYLLSPMFIISIYSLLKAVKSQKTWKFFLSGLLFGVTLYTYAVSYIIMPVFLLLTFIYLIKIKKVNLKQTLIFAIPLGILAFPLIIMLMVQKGWINEINGFISIPKMHKNRINDVNILNIGENILSLRNVFIEPLLDYNGISGYGPLYPLGVLLMCIGLVMAPYTVDKDKNKKTEVNLTVIMLFAFIANFLLSLFSVLNINKANGIYISATYFIFLSIVTLKDKARTLATILTILLITIFMFFTTEYFTNFAKQDYSYFDNGDIEVLEHVYNSDLKDRKIRADINYIYSLYVRPVSPYEFYENIKIMQTPVGIEVIGYNNYTEIINLSNLQDDIVYITHREDVANIIEEAGYTKETYKRYYILYK